MTEELEQTNEEQLQQIKDNVGEKYSHSELHINRVPDHTIEKLKKLASEKFANDYGMALTFLLELKELKDEFDTQLQATTSKVMELEAEVEQLKHSQNKADESSGKEINTIG